MKEKGAGGPQPPLDEEALFAELRRAHARLRVLRREIAGPPGRRRRAASRAAEAARSLASIRIGVGLVARESKNTLLRDRASVLQRSAERLQRLFDRRLPERPPLAMDSTPLAPSFAQMCRAMAAETGGRVQFEFLGLDGLRLTEEIETEVSRVVREAVLHALRRAGAGRVSVILQRRGAGVRLIVEDDVERRDGRDLASLRERVEAHGAALTIESLPGTGTSFVVEFPAA